MRYDYSQDTANEMLEAADKEIDRLTAILDAMRAERDAARKKVIELGMALAELREQIAELEAVGNKISAALEQVKK